MNKPKQTARKRQKRGREVAVPRIRPCAAGINLASREH